MTSRCGTWHGVSRGPWPSGSAGGWPSWAGSGADEALGECDDPHKVSRSTGPPRAAH
jgi:hypothetical protein